MITEGKKEKNRREKADLEEPEEAMGDLGVGPSTTQEEKSKSRRMVGFVLDDLSKLEEKVVALSIRHVLEARDTIVADNGISKLGIEEFEGL